MLWGFLKMNIIQITGLGMLIVGSPTRAFRATPATSVLLRKIPANGLEGANIAAFDTRMPMTGKVPAILRFMSRLFGYAAQSLSTRLERKGGRLAIPPEGFFVEGTEGPLKAGELERAADWARRALKSPT